MKTSAVRTVAGGDPGDFLTVRHIRAGGSQREIGRQLAAAAHAVHGPAAAPRAAADRLVERARRRWFDMHHPAQAARMRGVADYFGLDRDEPFALLPPDDGPIGTAALTYKRWRTITAMNAGGPVVDDDDIRAQFTAVRLEAPVRRPERSGMRSTTSRTPPSRCPPVSTS